MCNLIAKSYKQLMFEQAEGKTGQKSLFLLELRCFGYGGGAMSWYAGRMTEFVTELSQLRTLETSVRRADAPANT